MAAAAPPFLMPDLFDTEARFSDSCCHLLLRWKIRTSPSLIKNAVSPEMHSVRLAPARPWSSSRHPGSAGAGQAPPAPPWCARSAVPVSVAPALPVQPGPPRRRVHSRPGARPRRPAPRTPFVLPPSRQPPAHVRGPGRRRLGGHGRLRGQRSSLGHLLVRVLDQRLCVLSHSFGLGSRPFRLGVHVSGDPLDPFRDLLLWLLAFLVDQAIETLASLLGTPLNLLLPLTGRLTHAPFPVLAHGLGRVGALARGLRLGQRLSFCLFRPGAAVSARLSLTTTESGAPGSLAATAIVIRRKPSEVSCAADWVAATGDLSAFDNSHAPLRGRSLSADAAWPATPILRTDCGHAVFPRATRPLLICGSGFLPQGPAGTVCRFCEELCRLHPGDLLGYLSGSVGACGRFGLGAPTESDTHCSGH